MTGPLPLEVEAGVEDVELFPGNATHVLLQLSAQSFFD
jgi:hypothetical protein